ncbi:Cd2+/Zn2+-exporting ATPase [Clostridium amylolyticum]|uniref:Cd2+/Zn2+-exporting ATPase n=1 Tax=Clostridium amylolyticum TaxID=1121298 RepID=A0A1M6MD94_9CLOT|nr:heavy metal translocating P-type ATPase [Clostridium amylolyticum]SHJ81410.1 Cd2+/Zn2+-exporting ATPase [Clostridium amylolyticum]
MGENNRRVLNVEGVQVNNSNINAVKNKDSHNGNSAHNHHGCCNHESENNNCHSHGDEKDNFHNHESEDNILNYRNLNNNSRNNPSDINKSSNKNYEFILENLDCANCAAKIENKIQNISGVSEAFVNFTTKKLTFSLDAHEEYERVLQESKDIIKKLEPEVVVKSIDKNVSTESRSSSNEEDNEELKGKFIQFSVAFILFLTALIFDLPEKIEILTLFVSYLLAGGEVVLRAFKNILRGQVFDENFLMSVATIGAFAIGDYAEGAAVMLFYQVGELFQDLAVNRSRKSIADLMDIRPDYANLLIGGQVKKVSPEDVMVGDIIVVKPGEKVPLDGIVVEGTSMMDTSALTGESVPREIETGSEVLGGFVNKNGLIHIKVSKVFGESTVTKILNLVENASSRKAPTENFITKFARYYTPAVVITALVLAVVPPLVISGATFSDWVYRALIFLVISCPCALVVSIPLGFFGGIGGASKNGILVKGSNYLEALNSIETVVFDKTGTLTKGVFNVTEIHNEKGFNKNEILQYAAFAESHSNHPIATSIIKAYGKELDKNQVKSYEEIAGHGTRALVEGKEILAGNSKLMNKENINYTVQDSAGTIVYLAIDKKYAGYIVISDEIKEDAQKAIQDLKKLGIKNTIMLTGDSKKVGTKVGETLGLDKVYSELLPQDKVEKLELIDSQKSSQGKVVFVGDGINDAPVLARADIGIAMGGLGSDAAIEAADVVIMTDEPSKIASAIKIAKNTRKIVWQNIIFALGVKLIVLIMGAFGVATMWEAVFADVGVALIAVLNAMRVLRYNPN